MMATLTMAACAGAGSSSAQRPATAPTESDGEPPAELAAKFERALGLAEAVALAADDPRDGCDGAAARLDAIAVGRDGDAMTVLIADPRWPTHSAALKRRYDARGQAYAERLMAALDRCGDHAPFTGTLTRLGLAPRKVSSDQ